MTEPTRLYGWVDDDGYFCVSRFDESAPWRPHNKYIDKATADAEAARRSTRNKACTIMWADG